MQIEGRRWDTGQAVRLSLDGQRIGRVDALEIPTDDAAHLPWICPPLVDIQFNGWGGQEFGAADLTAQKVARIVDVLAGQGVGRICPTVTTASDEVMRHAARTISEACEQFPRVARAVLAIHQEGPYLSPEDGPRGAHPRQHCRPPDWDHFQRLQEAAGGRIRLLTLAPEWDGAAEFITRATASGVIVSLGHTAADSEQIRAAVDAGARLSTHLGNGAHGTLRRHPNYLWDQMAEDRLWASLIVDGHHLPPAVVKSLVRAKTPERCLLVSDASGMAGLPPGRYATSLCELEILSSGKIVLAGQEQLLAGASAPLGTGVANVMRYAGVDLATAMAMAVQRPLELFSLPEPRLAEGELADLVLFDLPGADGGGPLGEWSIRETWIAGQQVYRA